MRKSISILALCLMLLSSSLAAGSQELVIKLVADVAFSSFYPGTKGDFALLQERRLSYYDAYGKQAWTRDMGKKVKDVLVLVDGSVAVLYDYQLMLISSDGETEREVPVNDEAVTLVAAPDGLIIAGHAYGAQAFDKETLSTVWDYYPHDECDY